MKLVSLAMVFVILLSMTLLGLSEKRGLLGMGKRGRSMLIAGPGINASHRTDERSGRHLSRRTDERSGRHLSRRTDERSGRHLSRRTDGSNGIISRGRTGGFHRDLSR